jgi:hypothetical protein
VDLQPARPHLAVQQVAQAAAEVIIIRHGILTCGSKPYELHSYLIRREYDTNTISFYLCMDWRNN